jgi:hypothetical protein
LRQLWRHELVMVPKQAEILPHSNRSENDIRCYVFRRKVRAPEHCSDRGRNRRDAFLASTRLATSLAFAFWDYLGSRFKMAGHIFVQPLDYYFRGRSGVPDRQAPHCFAPLTEPTFNLLRGCL